MGKEKPKSIEVWPVVKPFVNGGASLTTCVIQPSDMIKDARLASIAETEKQTELAARVSTWKQRIENNLEEQDSRPPFNIHEYGERILEKLSMDADSGNTISFADVIRGQEKHDVAQTFSTLLQMVYERSLSGSGASPNVAAATQFVKAGMLPSGYFIWPCKGGGSIIHKVDMLVWISCQAS